MTDSLATVFQRCREENRAALIGYMPCGFPDANRTHDVVRTMVENGCDIVEVGVPYSDPMMDGPTIQAASQQALDGGTRVADVFDVVKTVAEAGATPVVMSYFNPILQYGVDKFASDLAAAGGVGIITPDLIPDEAALWLAASEKHGLDRIFLVAPSTSDARLEMTLAHTSGFVYAVAVMGVTGARNEVSSLPQELCARIQKISDIPIGVGLGVTNREQASQIAAYSDGVIVGSALVTAAQQGLPQLAELVSDLAAGVRRR